jgi:predicted dienelactone hydrolase
MAGRIIKWLVRILTAVAMFAVAALALLFALLWREHKTEITLPAPTGHFAVGRTTYAWTNPAATGESAASPASKREVVVWLWYPSGAMPPGTTAEYLPAPWRAALAQYSGVLLTEFFTRDLSLVRTHSTSDPDVSPEQRSYPVVIMRAGGGALTTDYTTLAEDLASHGYIVVGLDAPYRTIVVSLPHNRVVTRPPTNDPEDLPADQASRLINKLLLMWISDMKFVVSQLENLNAADPSGKFTGRMDLQRLGMFGHSFGGAQALQFCHDDARCKAAIDLDGALYGSVVQEGVKQPIMFVFSNHSHEISDPASKQIQADIESIYRRLPSDRFMITIRGAHHFSFSDQSLLKSQYLTRALTSALGFGKLEPRRGLAITASYVHSFFDIYLKDAPPTLLDVSAQYPEVEVGIR